MNQSQTPRLYINPPLSWPERAIARIAHSLIVLASFILGSAGHVARMAVVRALLKGLPINEDTRERDSAARAVGRIAHAWGLSDDEIATSIVEARATFERTADRRASGLWPDYHHTADEAAGQAGAGLEEVKDALAGGMLLEAVVHVCTIAELANAAAAAAEAEACLEPTDTEQIRCINRRAWMATGYAQEAADLLFDFVHAQRYGGPGDKLQRTLEATQLASMSDSEEECDA